jgi:catechol 2,3-dioxygenase-like lactoylglutathione lyase family enzyme
MARARLVGINHIALEVGEIDAALAFYGRLLDFELRGRVGSRMAFLDAGDQFVALAAGRTQATDDGRHFGLVVDDAEALRTALDAAGVERVAGSRLDFRDPWGNRIQIVQYDEIQFTKTPGVLRAMGLDGLGKTAAAVAELRRKGIED